MVVVDGNAAKEFIEDNDETQDLEMPVYYVGLDIVKPHLISCTLGKYIPYYWHLLVILWPLGYNSITPPKGGRFPNFYHDHKYMNTFVHYISGIKL